jgi:fumarate reductase subunit D
MARSNEPIWWLLFAAGMMVAGMLAPVLIFLTGIAGPLGLPGDWFTYARLSALAGHWLTRLVVLVFVSLSLFLWAHRFRFTLFDLGLHKGRMAVAVLCYGGAIAGTIAAVMVVW